MRTDLRGDGGAEVGTQPLHMGPIGGKDAAVGHSTGIWCDVKEGETVPSCFQSPFIETYRIVAFLLLCESLFKHAWTFDWAIFPAEKDNFNRVFAVFVTNIKIQVNGVFMSVGKIRKMWCRDLQKSPAGEYCKQKKNLESFTCLPTLSNKIAVALSASSKKANNSWTPVLTCNVTELDANTASKLIK